MRVSPVQSPSHEAHSPRRERVLAFPVSHQEHLCRWRFRHDVLLRTWAGAWRCSLHRHRRHPAGHSFQPTLLSRLLLPNVLPSTSQLSPRLIYAHPDPPYAPSPPLQAECFRRFLLYCTIDKGRFYSLPSTTSSYFISCQQTVLRCTNIRVKEKRACEERSSQKVLNRQCHQYRQYHHPSLLH